MLNMCLQHKPHELIRLGPLMYGDERYVKLKNGRDPMGLQCMQLQIRDADSIKGNFAKIAVTGHRGCGKTTELRQLEHCLSDKFVPHFFHLSNHVLRDCDHLA